MTEPTDAEIMLEASKVGGLFDDLAIGYQSEDILKFARAVLARRGQPSGAGEPVTPFIPAQRERLYYNRPENVGKDASLADWHRIVQYIEAAHGIKGKEAGNAE